MRVSPHMTKWIGPAMACWLAAAACGSEADAVRPARVAVRWQEAVARGERFETRATDRALVPRETVILICDTWDKHWCRSATARCEVLAGKIEALVAVARKRGVLIVHAPSDTIDFYRDHPARKRALALPVAKPPLAIESWCSLDKAREGELPIDDSDGGCDCQPQCRNHKAWTRQHPAITIDPGDLISDNGQEIYNYFVERGIKNVIYVGVHTNMCVLGRSFGIRQMTRLGFDTILTRDLTDTMYNPRMRPFVAHTAGTDLVVEHIERHWCPTTVSASLVEALR